MNEWLETISLFLIAKEYSETSSLHFANFSTTYPCLHYVLYCWLLYKPGLIVDIYFSIYPPWTWSDMKWIQMHLSLYWLCNPVHKSRLSLSLLRYMHVDNLYYGFYQHLSLSAYILYQCRLLTQPHANFWNQSLA